MDANLDDKESLMARIQQLEHERDELRKDIEQLCIQQAGPSYLVVATRMHFQRTAGLEQEIENLKKKLAACTRDNTNLQEELSEAYHIKSQLSDLHCAEVEKVLLSLYQLLDKHNMEAEKQLKFFQSCVAAAFAERDQSIMEAEKAKENEEFMSQKFSEIQNRLEELMTECLEHKRFRDELQISQAKLEEQNDALKKVVNKFYHIRQQSLEEYDDINWDDKCASLLHDSMEMWSYNDTSTSKYISALEEELETMRNSLDNLRNKQRVGLEIENHLKRRVCELEKKQIQLDKLMMNSVARLCDFHSQKRVEILNLLGEGRSQIEWMINMVQEKIRQLDASREQNLQLSHQIVNTDDNVCRVVHINADAVPALLSKRDDHKSPDTAVCVEGNTSEVLAQALQEKVAALLLLSQQEERHLLERNVNAALQKKVEELQRNLLQVTNEKVKALMELAQLKQEYRLLVQERIEPEIKQGNAFLGIRKRFLINERDGPLRNLLKKTSLTRWIGALDLSGNETGAHQNGEGNVNSVRSNNMDFARMKIENATLKEGMESMEHLTSSIHRLRLAIVKVKESIPCVDNFLGISEALDNIVSEAKLVKTALGSSLPISWSADTEGESIGLSVCSEPDDVYGDTGSNKIDFVCAAGFEMVELLILAAQILKGETTKRVTNQMEAV